MTELTEDSPEVVLAAALFKESPQDVWKSWKEGRASGAGWSRVSGAHSGAGSWTRERTNDPKGNGESAKTIEVL